MKIGNDELILYIRKNFDCTKTNDILGREIWKWIQTKDTEAVITGRDIPCLWGDSPDITSDTGLPKTAAQFIISAKILPDLYNFLDELAESN